MALIKCYECEKEISDQAPACPHCGAPKEEQLPELEEAEILEGVAVVDEPEPITQETISASRLHLAERLRTVIERLLTGQERGEGPYSTRKSPESGLLASSL